jgi:hypothetical protein
MKSLEILLVLSLTFIINSCLGSCYDRLTLIKENSNIVLLKDSSAIFSNSDLDLILNQCVTDCSYDTIEKDKMFIFINSSIIPNKKLMLKNEYFVMTDSLNRNYHPSYFRIDNSTYDSLMLFPSGNYRIAIAFFSDYENDEYFYAPFKVDIAYKLLEEDALKYILKDNSFGVKPWGEIAEEWSKDE